MNIVLLMASWAWCVLQLTKRLQLTSCLMGPEACDPATRAQKEVQQQQEAQDVAQSSKPRDRNKQEQKKGSGPAQQQQHLFFSRHQVTEGSYLNFTPDVGMANKAQLSTYLHLAAPYVYIVAPQPTVGEDRGQERWEKEAGGSRGGRGTACEKGCSCVCQMLSMLSSCFSTSRPAVIACAVGCVACRQGVHADVESK